MEALLFISFGMGQAQPGGTYPQASFVRPALLPEVWPLGPEEVDDERRFH